MEKKDCYTCAYKGSVAGSCHISCRFNWLASELKMPEGNKHGIKSGWYNFPFNYDPVWMTGECQAHSVKADEKMIRKEDPMETLLSILMR